MAGDLNAKHLDWNSRLFTTRGTPHIVQVKKKAAQRLVLLSSLNSRSGLSITNGVLLYKQLIPTRMDYWCPTWRSTACSHLRKLQVIQSKCLSIVTGAPWYISNVQVHEDLGVPFFAEHIRIPNREFRLKDRRCGGNPLDQQLGRYLR